MRREKEISKPRDEVSVRLDKWLWAARLFKTRALAQRACELGRIRANGLDVKPSREVRVGDLFSISREGIQIDVQVLGISQLRGPASVAQLLYLESSESVERRKRIVEERKLMPVFDPLLDGRPSKRDRRLLGKLKGRL